jgi:hypothetical protein
MFAAFFECDAATFDLVITAAGLDYLSVAVLAQFMLVGASIQIHFCDSLYDSVSQRVDFRLGVQLKRRLKADFFPPPFSYANQVRNSFYIHSNSVHRCF